MSAALLSPPCSAATDAPKGEQFSTYVKTYHEYLRIRRHLGPSAYFVLSALQEHSHGYGLDTTRVPLSARDIEDTLGLSENTVRAALRKLEHFQLVRSNAESVKRTQKRHWTLLPPAEWSDELRALMTAHLTPLPVLPAPHRARTKHRLVVNTTAAKIDGVGDGAESINTTPSKTADDVVAATVKIEEVVLIAPSIFDGVTPPEAAVGQGADEGKERSLKEKATKETEDSNLSVGSAATAPPTPAPSVTTPRKAPKAPKEPREPKEPKPLTPAMQYRVDLLAAILAVNDGVKPPKRDAEWAAAGKFYTHRAGIAPIADVVACYEAERAAPAWDTRYLSLMTLVGCYDAYMRSPANYRAGIARKRAAVQGQYDQPARAARRGSNTTTGDHASVDGDLTTDDLAAIGKRHQGREGKGTTPDAGRITGTTRVAGTEQTARGVGAAPAGDVAARRVAAAPAATSAARSAPADGSGAARATHPDRRPDALRGRPSGPLGSTGDGGDLRPDSRPDSRPDARAFAERDPIGSGAYTPSDREYLGEDDPEWGATLAARRRRREAQAAQPPSGATRYFRAD